jgi:ATP-dependent DNA helicase RecG
MSHCQSKEGQAMAELGSFAELDALSLIRHLNETDEHARCEAKTSRAIGRSLMETICAFSNEPQLGGGYLLLGASKSNNSLFPTYEFVGIDDPDKLQTEICTRCRTDFNRPVRPLIKCETVGRHTAMIVFVPELGASEKPIYFVSEHLPQGAYRRIGSTDQRCSEDDLHVFYGAPHAESYDRQIVSDGSLDDIDPKAIANYRAMREGVRPDAPELMWSDAELLASLSCAKMVDGVSRPTVGGLLLFGKRTALRRCFPMTRVDYIRIQGTEWVKNPDERFDTVEIRDPLIRTIQKAHATVVDDLPKTFSLPAGSLQREDIPTVPDRVIREVLVNAVMHRCYRTQGPIQIMRYSNRLEIRNPGHSLISDDRLGEPGSETRNSVIAAVLYEIGLAEQKGSGIPTMLKLMKAASLGPPVFESDREGNRFLAFLLIHNFLTEETLAWLAGFSELGLTNDERVALVMVRELGAINNAAYRGIGDFDTNAASSKLRRLRDLGLLEMRGRGIRTYYVGTPLLLTGKSGELKSKSGEQQRKSGELSSESADDSPPEELAQKLSALGKKSPREHVRRLILELCEWRALMPTELAMLLKRSSPKRLTADYISPMAEQGVLARTIPDNPTHPAQRYRITPLGSQELL